VQPSARPPVIVALGRLVPPKGHRVPIEALPYVRARIPAVQALIMGDGPLRAELEQLAARVGVGGWVTFAGEVLDPALRLAACDLFVYPSLKGALGLAGLEAMACGVPVVASHLEATPEFVKPNVTGVLVSAGDPRALGEAIVALLLDPARRQTLASAAGADVRERFGVDRFVHEHLALYRALISSRRHRMEQHPCPHQIRTNAGTSPIA
jgi:glycosyltransferase involved in cell wall biosynthesis